MSRVNEDYLLNKIASRSVFNIAESKSETIRTLKLYYDDSPDYHEAVAEISNIDAFTSEEAFYYKVRSVAPQLDFEEIAIIKDYPYHATVAANIFIRYIQPEMKKLDNEKGR